MHDCLVPAHRGFCGVLAPQGIGYRNKQRGNEFFLALRDRPFEPNLQQSVIDRRRGVLSPQTDTLGAFRHSPDMLVVSLGARNQTFSLDVIQTGSSRPISHALCRGAAAAGPLCVCCYLKTHRGLKDFKRNQLP